MLNKLLNSYSELDKSFKLTIEVIEKNINEQQISLYNAFIIKASEHFGNTFQEMENILKRFWPKWVDIEGIKEPKDWVKGDLENFINQASALLAEQGFKF